MGSAILWTLIVTLAAEPKGLDEARRLWQNGRYAEAQEGYEALLKEPEKLDPAVRVKAILGQADCLASQGEGAKALEELARAAAAQPASADLAARLAELRFGRGDWEGADRAVAEALKVDADHLAARWVEARLLEARGELDEAVEAWKWFVDQLQRQAAGNRQGRRRAADRRPGRRALLPGQGAGRGAERVAQRRASTRSTRARCKADPHCWQAPWLEGRLFLSGYNEGDARKELTRPCRSTRGGRGPGDARPGRPPGLQARRRPVEGRAGAGDQPALRPGVRPAGRPEHLRRAVRRRPRRGPEGRRREPARRGRPGPAGGLVPAAGRPGGRGGRRGGGPGEQPPARHLLRRPGRAAGRPPQVPLGRAGLPARRRRRPRPRRRPDRPGDALHADRPRGRGQRPLRRRLRRRPVQRPRRQHDEGAQAHGHVHAGRRPSTSASWSTRRRTSSWASTCRGTSSRSTAS